MSQVTLKLDIYMKFWLKQAWCSQGFFLWCKLTVSVRVLKHNYPPSSAPLQRRRLFTGSSILFLRLWVDEELKRFRTLYFLFVCLFVYRLLLLLLGLLLLRLLLVPVLVLFRHCALVRSYLKKVFEVLKLYKLFSLQCEVATVILSS